MAQFRVHRLFTFTLLLGLFIIIHILVRNQLPLDRDSYASEAEKENEKANVFVELSKKISPSVVNISSITTVTNGLGNDDPEELLKKFFGELFHSYQNPEEGSDGQEEEENQDEDQDLNPRVPTPGQKKHLHRAISLGTGFIIDSSGLILTNNHVVADSDEIKITFTEEANELPTDGKVVGRDSETDIALIRVKSKRKIMPLRLGNSDHLEVGEFVMAVGNPFGQGHTISHGIISAKGRQSPDFPFSNYLQIDVPINPGNSGGPLVNLKGDVIGINNAIDQRGHRIGFAIPIQLVKAVLPQLKAHGKVTRGFIGLSVENLTSEVAVKIGESKDLQALVVTDVFPKGPAAIAGVKPYDVILELNQKKILSEVDLNQEINSNILQIGKIIPIKISRAGKEKLLKIRINHPPVSKGSLKQAQNLKENSKHRSMVNIGMKLEDLSSELRSSLELPDKIQGVIVSEVADHGPADQAGLSEGDIILEIDKKPVNRVNRFYSIVKQKKSHLLRVLRVDSQGNQVFEVLVLNLRQK